MVCGGGREGRLFTSPKTVESGSTKDTGKNKQTNKTSNCNNSKGIICLVT